MKNKFLKKRIVTQTEHVLACAVYLRKAIQRVSKKDFWKFTPVMGPDMETGPDAEATKASVADYLYVTMRQAMLVVREAEHLIGSCIEEREEPSAAELAIINREVIAATKEAARKRNAKKKPVAKKKKAVQAKRVSTVRGKVVPARKTAKKRKAVKK